MHRIRRVALGLAAGVVAVTTAVVPTPDGPAAEADEPVFPWSTGFATDEGGTLSGDARITGGRLRLTGADFDAAGAWAMDDVFPSSLGLDIEFDYAMYTPDTLGADGLLLYLADGAVPPGVGAYGAGLGYACRSAVTQGGGPCTLPGLPGGFAAVAIDQYGNFSLPLNDSGPGRTPDAVTVRGSGNGTAGYRFVQNAVVDGGVATGSPATRKVRVVLQPEDDGLSLTVRLQTADGMRTVLDRVPLQGDGQAPLPETLRLGFAAATGSNRSVHEVDTLSVSQPADLRVVHDVPPVVAGERVSYTVTASNVGRNASAPSPLTVDVPDALHDVTWTCAAGGGSTCGAAAGTGDVSTVLGLPRGGSATVTVEGVLDAAVTGVLESVATVGTASGLSDTAPEDNVSDASVPVGTRAQLTTSKSVAPDAVAPGDEVAYTVTAHNEGPSTAVDVGAVDDLPERVAFVGSDDDCSAEGQRVTCRTDAAVAPGGEAAFHFRARLDDGYRGDGSDVVNVATATSPTDPDGGDESPGVPLVVVDPGDGDGDGGEDPGDGDDGEDPGDGDDGKDPGDGDDGADPGDGDDGADPGDGDDGADPGDGDDGAGPGDGGSPTAAGPTPTRSPSPAPAGTGRNGQSGTPGALAYTGVEGVAAALAVAVLTSGAGVGVWAWRRRRATPTGRT